jgi:hypothetical protein
MGPVPEPPTVVVCAAAVAGNAINAAAAAAAARPQRRRARLRAWAGAASGAELGGSPGAGDSDGREGRQAMPVVGRDPLPSRVGSVVADGVVFIAEEGDRRASRSFLRGRSR